MPDCNECPFHRPVNGGGCTRLENGMPCAKQDAPEEGGSALDSQVGGDHYKNLGSYQPWLILKASLTPEEFRGYMKGTALVYLLRDGKKGAEDVDKACHTLAGFLELTDPPAE